ncbi:MAG: hypothetical protein IPK26_19835 [Planctomycetes bacterium]|nr:hypothetical protein [Planctomycetota bacterium]
MRRQGGGADAAPRVRARAAREDLLRGAELWFLPIYNPDGNEAVDRKNRPEQNGPDTVGKRPNGQGLDLNRDFVKADAPETRALLRLIDTVDPHVFMDLHTTDGSTHGYHLTFAPSLATSLDPGDRQLRAQAARWRDHDDAASPRLPRVRLRQTSRPAIGKATAGGRARGNAAGGPTTGGPATASIGSVCATGSPCSARPTAMPTSRPGSPRLARSC